MHPPQEVCTLIHISCAALLAPFLGRDRTVPRFLFTTPAPMEWMVFLFCGLLVGCERLTSPSGEEEGGGEPPGIRLTLVEANQGVGIRILEEGIPIPLSARNAPLIENRETLIWALWEVDDGWVRRTVRAELKITVPDGREETKVQQRFVVEGAQSSFESFDLSFAWALPPELAVHGATYQLTLTLPGSGGVGGGEIAAGAFPSSPEPIGFEESYQVIRVTLVPVQHQYEDSCSEIPELSHADVETFGELLHRRNPTERVVMTLREPYVWTESLSSYSGLLAALSQLRFQDGADPAEYYAGLVHHCVRTGGQAITIPPFPTRDNAWTRTVVSAWRGAAPLSSTTFVHEMGHAQGRRHVRCTGAEGSPDPHYPYPAGNIGVWGYSIPIPDARIPWLSGNTYHPETSYDYMGYCTGPQHVSDYGWGLVYPFIREISGWELEDPAPAPSPVRPEGSHRLLVGLLDQEGREHWFEVPGRASDREPTPGSYLELTVEGVPVLLPVWEGAQPHGAGRIVVAELPVPLERVSRIFLESSGMKGPVDLGRVQRLR